MNTEHLKEIRSSEILRKRLAKVMALRCFRNTKLEDLHAGTFPSSEAGDYSDVQVVSPFGEIPWKSLSRFDDKEMKTLLIDVVDHCHRFLWELFATPYGDHLIEQLK
jgi:ligand-binding SRPBCC domain-containing protein